MTILGNGLTMIATRRKILAAMVAIFAIPPNGLPQEITWKEGGVPCTLAERFVPTAQFNRAILLKLALFELARLEGSRFVYVTFRDGRTNPGVPIDNLSYSIWRHMWEQEAHKPLRVARLVRIGDDAILDVHNVTEISRMQLIGKGNPLKIRTQDAEAEIRYFAFGSPIEAVANFGRVPDPITVYVTTDRPSVPYARELYARARDLLPSRLLRMYLRSDPYFVVPGLPIRLPFLTGSPPDESELAASHTFMCGFSSEVGPYCSKR